MGIRGKFFAALIGMAVLVAGVTFWILTESNDELITMEANRIAEIVSSQILADRAIYTRDLVGKLRADGTGAARDSHDRAGYILLPAQFVRSVSRRVAETAGHLYRYSLISEWNLNEDQGLKDDFDLWAWGELAAQDESYRGQAPPADGYSWTAASRIDDVEGESVLRYMRADPASAPSCVSCHNGYELRPAVQEMRTAQGVEPGKQWELHQLMGAIRVEIPLASVEEQAAGARFNVLASLLGVLALGFLGLLSVLYVSVIKPTEASIREVDQFKDLVDTVVSRTRDLLGGTEAQFDAIEKSEGELDSELIRNTAMQNASNAQLAAASCNELEEGFNTLNARMRSMLGED